MKRHAAAICLVLVYCSYVRAGMYTYVEIPNLGGTNANSASGIDDHGHVTGGSEVASANIDGFLWDSAGMTRLGYLSSTRATSGHAINDAGQIAGESALGSMGGHWAGHRHAILWESGVMTDLGTLSGRASSSALGINSARVVVGHSYTYNGGYRDAAAFRWEGGSMVDLNPAFGMDESRAFAINDSGQIAAQAWSTGSDDRYGFVWEGGVATPLGGFAPFDITNLGTMAGTVQTASGVHAAIWEHGAVTDLTDLTGVGDYASRINERGEVLMISGGARYDSYVWSSDGLTHLNKVVADYVGISADDLWLEARDLNNLGQITGMWRVGNESHMFVLTPDVVPLPSAVLLGVMGLGTAQWRLRRRRAV